MLMFQLNRVNYDFKNQKLVKDNSRFEFDKQIYLDLFLNQNKEQAAKHYEKLDQMRADLRLLKDTYSQYQAKDSSTKLCDAIAQTEQLLKTNDSPETLCQSVMVGNEKIQFYDPKQLT